MLSVVYAFVTRIQVCGFLTGVLAYQLAINLQRNNIKPPRLVQWLILTIIGTSMITWFGTLSDTRWLFFLLTPIAVVCYALREGHWLSGKVAVELGRLSYAIYLLHIPVLYAFESVWGQDGAKGLGIKLCMIATVLLLSKVVHHAVELPMIRWGRYLVGRRAVFVRSGCVRS